MSETTNAYCSQDFMTYIACKRSNYLFTPRTLCICRCFPMSFPFGGFLKGGYPPIIHFSGIFPYEPEILGYPHDYGTPHLFVDDFPQCLPLPRSDDPVPSRSHRFKAAISACWVLGSWPRQRAAGITGTGGMVFGWSETVENQCLWRCSVVNHSGTQASEWDSVQYPHHVYHGDLACIYIYIYTHTYE